MQIQIHTHQFDLTDAIKGYIEQRAAFALGWNPDGLLKINLRLADSNGSRGSMDKSCQVVLRFKGKKDLVVEDTQTDLYLAIDRALERASRSLARQARHQEIHHQRFRLVHDKQDAESVRLL